MSDRVHRPRKRFGQNFLHNAGIIQRIVRAIDPRAGDQIVEIGPGQGALTGAILEQIDHLHAVELDRDLIPALESEFGTRLDIHSADALKFDFCSLISGDHRLRIIGNLPYNISTPLLFHLMTQRHCIFDMHFMLQKEVVVRMAAGPGSKAYGRLGIMLQYYCRVERLFTVPPGAFRPPPKVDSAIVRLIPHEQPPVTVQDEDDLAQLVTQAFSQRRKTLRNTLKGLLDEAGIRECGIDPGLRPEQLALADFAALADRYTSSKSRN
ncbi:MAG: 16S rRNA (adenine(1518)-N(6)/adenine(1519)-N(6))-dimethyltransferase RsmA [Gammaproteobacteria bacterium]|nr:16S rRNA (adenine(1518)-N(6)/adenine(1519)-N(6))-dimethyltransferase RsmA [Gammaproteobacteria bacterium]